MALDISRLHNAKIGWVVGKYEHEPAIRRRFAWYARCRHLPMEEADPNKRYDAIWLSQSADYTVWSKHDPANGPIVMDLCDDYLAYQPYTVKDIARAIGKFIFRQYRTLRVSSHGVLQDMCRRADVVICATDAQEARIRRYCPNVHQILDMHVDEIEKCKTDYSIWRAPRIMWDGLPGNICSFSDIMPSLIRVRQQTNFSIHLITAIRRASLMRDYWPRDTLDIIRHTFGIDQVYLYEWNIHMVSALCLLGDIAILPVTSRDPFSWGKPANRLLWYWRLGIPTITSATPAYVKLMNECGLDMTCATSDQWEEKLIKYMTNESARQEAGEQAKAFVEAEFSEEKQLARWDAALASVLSC
jgi:glycosyltransferase involved in cell wall biosynthesis